jgi:hypothetical protein
MIPEHEFKCKICHKVQTIIWMWGDNICLGCFDKNKLELLRFKDKEAKP